MHRTGLGLALLTFMGVMPLAAQQPSPAGIGIANGAPRVELSLGYSYVLAKTVIPSGCCFNMHGGSASVAANVTESVGLVADVGGYHTNNVRNSGLTLTVISYTFGPRLSIRREHFTPFAHALFGAAHGGGTLYTTGFPGGRRTAFATILGGGLDINVSRIAIRAIEADWLFTKLPNGVDNRQHNLRLTAGIVFRFGGN